MTEKEAAKLADLRMQLADTSAALGRTAGLLRQAAQGFRDMGHIRTADMMMAQANAVLPLVERRVT